MDSSDEENIKDILPTDKTKDEKYPEFKEIGETLHKKEFMLDTQVSSSVKRKSEICLDNKRKRSTDNVRKTLDESLLDCSNKHDTVLTENQSTKHEKNLSTEILPSKRNYSVQECENEADQSTNEEKGINSEESHSATRAIKDSINEYFSKQKTEECTKSRRTRSAYNLRKHLDGNLTADQSKQNQECLDAVSCPCTGNESIRKSAKQADECTAQERSIISQNPDSNTQAIKTSIVEYILNGSVKSKNVQSDRWISEAVDVISSGLINMLENITAKLINQLNLTSGRPTSENINLETSGIYSPSNNTKLIDENQFEKEHMCNKSSTSLESEKSFPECKQDRLCTPRKSHPEISPGKRKSEQTAEDEIKRMRSVDNSQIDGRNYESLSEGLNERDSTSYASHSKICKEHVNTVISIDDATEGCANKQNIALNQTDQSVIKCKKTENKSGTDNETGEIQTSRKSSVPVISQSSDKTFPLEHCNICSTGNLSIPLVEWSFLSSISINTKNKLSNPPNKVKDESTYEDIALSKNEDIASDNSENPKLVHQKQAEDELVKFHSKMTKTDIMDSCETPSQMSQSSVNMSKSDVSNSTKSRENAPYEEHLLRQDETTRRYRIGRISRFSPPEISSHSKCQLKPTDIEPELKFINVERLETDPEFLKSQEQILESISHQQQISTIPESDDKENFLKQFKNRNLIRISPEFPKEAALKIYELVEIIVDNFNSKGLNAEYLDGSDLISLLMELADTYYPELMQYIPFVTMNRPDNRQSPESVNEITEANDRALSPVESPDKLPHVVNPISPISPPSPKNEPDKISEADLSEFREYPGLAEDLKNVKKDARYQKKFYKEKQPVKLPKHWSKDKASYSESVQNADSDDNQRHSISYPPEIVSRIRKHSVNEGAKDPEFLLDGKCDDKLKEQSEEKLSAENLIQVKKDGRYPKKIYGKKHLLPVNLSGDENSSSESEFNIHSNETVIQIIGDNGLRRVSKISTREEISEQDPNCFSKDKDLDEELGKSDNLSDTLASASEYKSSFMEESPNSSQSNSPQRNIESKPQSIIEMSPQHEEITDTSMSTASQISGSVSGPSQCPRSQSS